MILHREMMISHNFTIILGVREKKRVPTGKHFFSREIIASPRRPQNPSPLDGPGYEHP